MKKNFEQRLCHLRDIYESSTFLMNLISNILSTILLPIFIIFNLCWHEIQFSFSVVSYINIDSTRLFYFYLLKICLHLISRIWNLRKDELILNGSCFSAGWLKNSQSEAVIPLDLFFYTAESELGQYHHNET